MRQDRFRIDARKRRIALGTDLNRSHTRTIQNAFQHARAGTIHAVDQKAVPGCHDRLQVCKSLDRGNVLRQEIHAGDRGSLRGLRQFGTEVLFDLPDNTGRARTAIAGLVLHAIPLRRIMRGRDHHAARCVAMTHTVAQRGRWRHVPRKLHGNARASQHLGNHPGKFRRAKPGVEADADTFARVLMLQHVVGDCGGGNAHVAVREVVGNDAAPAIRSELHGGLGSGCGRSGGHCRGSHKPAPIIRHCLRERNRNVSPVPQVCGLTQLYTSSWRACFTSSFTTRPTSCE